MRILRRICAPKLLEFPLSAQKHRKIGGILFVFLCSEPECSVLPRYAGFVHGLCGPKWREAKSPIGRRHKQKGGCYEAIVFGLGIYCRLSHDTSSSRGMFKKSTDSKFNKFKHNDCWHVELDKVKRRVYRGHDYSGFSGVYDENFFRFRRDLSVVSRRYAVCIDSLYRATDRFEPDYSLR